MKENPVLNAWYPPRTEKAQPLRRFFRGAIVGVLGAGAGLTANHYYNQPRVVRPDGYSDWAPAEPAPEQPQRAIEDQLPIAEDEVSMDSSDDESKEEPPVQQEEPSQPAEPEQVIEQEPLLNVEPSGLTKQQLKDILFRCRQRHWSLESDGTFNLDESGTVNVVDIVRAGGSRLGSIQMRDARIWNVLIYRPAQSINDLLSVAQDANLLPDRKEKAIHEIGLYSSAGRVAIPTLKELLATGSDALKPAVVTALAEIAKEDCVADLLPLTAIRNDAIRKAAIDALGNIGSKDAGPSLILCLANRQDCTPAIWALAKIGPDASEAIPSLMSIVRDSDDHRIEGLWGLGHIGPDPRTIVFFKEIIEKLKPEPQMRYPTKFVEGTFPYFWRVTTMQVPMMGDKASELVPSMVAYLERDLSYYRSGSSAEQPVFSNRYGWDFENVKTCIINLGLTGPSAKEAIPVLRKYLNEASGSPGQINWNDPSPIAKAAEAALQKINKPK
ncbi:HEAT repeat domain-containing protein [Candidatus Peregrinibacteria bacterium]|nr:HEAT repeat domain-containing protein [Candidatus Peregrinibacteria bacterium]